MKTRSIYLLTFLFLLSCSDDFLDTENPNAPDLASVLANPSDWEDVIARQFSVIWDATQHLHGGTVMAIMADVLTSQWGGCHQNLDAGEEPRIAILNTEAGRNCLITFSYYQNFEVIGSANDILRVMKENPEVEVPNDQGDDIREKLTSVSHFLRGMAYGNLAMKYDKAQYVMEDIDPVDAPSLPFDSYHDLLEKALLDLDKAIEIAEMAPDFFVEYYNGVTLSLEQYIRLIRTLQARYIMHVVRDASENEANDWQRILRLAREGVQETFVVQGDGGAEWVDGFKDFVSGIPNPWSRVDHRIIQVMAIDVQPRSTDTPIPEPEAIDQRLITDMLYLPTFGNWPNRGSYRFSNYKYIRYEYHYVTWAGDLPWILTAENDLIIAEALIRTGGDRQQAATLINTTRVGRGQLSELTGNETDQDILDAIMHERFIELLGQSGSNLFYDRRRLPDDDGSLLPYTGLQPGTARQFPIPARELNVLGEEIYTFGGF